MSKKKRMFCLDCGSTNLSVYYPTPEAVGHYVINEADLDTYGLLVLEPSAGTGDLAKLAADAGATVDCIELQPHFADDLRKTNRYRSVVAGDFLQIPVASIYDRVIMNPPFENGADMEHVLRAIEWLKPGGILVAIVSAMTGQRQRKADRAFAQVLALHDTKEIPLPPNSFAEVGTTVSCKMIRLVKHG